MTWWAGRGHRTYFVSLEMGAQELAERALSAVCFDRRLEQLPYRAISAGTRLSDEQVSRLEQAREQLSAWPVRRTSMTHLSHVRPPATRSHLLPG
jgi:replicative DNA helicase